MRIAAQQHPAFEQGRFRDDERVIHLLRRRQIPVPDSPGDPLDDAMPDRHEIQRLETPRAGIFAAMTAPGVAASSEGFAFFGLLTPRK